MSDDQEYQYTVRVEFKYAVLVGGGIPIWNADVQTVDLFYASELDNPSAVQESLIEKSTEVLEAYIRQQYSHPSEMVINILSFDVLEDT